MSTDLLTNSIHHAWWIVAMPFISGFIIIMGARYSKTLSMVLSVGTVFVGFVHSVLIFLALNGHVDPQIAELGHYQKNFVWFQSKDIILSVGFLIDNLSSMMLLVVTSVSLLVQIYTHGYMREDPGYSRFYAYLSLFTGSMLGLVVSTNLFQMYGFWELVGVCSYFLIGFWWYKTSAAEACLKAFVVNRIGDFGFLLGILLLLGATRDCWGGVNNPHTLLAFVDPQGFDIPGVIKTAIHNNTMVATGLGVASLTTIAILIFMGPMAKSAQFPLHVWLPDAMEGPTPISALIHAATMVAAGVYLVARAYPIFLTPDGSTHSFALEWVAYFGAFTAFMAATIGMSQFDIKRVLAWSTCSQLGYMFVGLGVGAFSGGLFHLFNHAFFKAMLFLCSGAVIHGLHGEQDIRKMGGLWGKMPITAWCFLIGTISISGVLPLSGFFSKDEIVGAALHANPFVGGVLLVTAGLTAFYMFRVFFLTFVGTYRGNAHPHESPGAMTMPLVALALPSITSGYLGFNLNSISDTTKALPNHFASFVYGPSGPHYEALHVSAMVGSVAIALAGFGIAYLIYYARYMTVNSSIANSTNPAIKFVYQLSFNKWWFDDMYLALAKGLIGLYQTVWRLIDEYIVDNLVNLSATVTMGLGEVLKYTQNGRGQYYALVIFAAVVGLTWIAYFVGGK